MLNETKVKEFKNRVKELYKMRVADLRNLASLKYRVGNFAGESKDVVISAILEAEFGRKFMKEINE